MKRNFRIEPRKWVALLATVHVILVLLATPRPAFSTTVILDWDASTDADLAGYKVYCQANSPSIPFQGAGAAEGSAPVDVANTLAAAITGLDPANSYFFAVTAYNSQGTESVYSNIIEIPEALPPTVVISSPANDASVAGEVQVTADATDNKGVTSVAFYVNGVLAGTDSDSPYSCGWDTSSLAAGNYTVVARASDAAGNMGESRIAVAVSGDTAAPAVSFSEPQNNALVTGTVTFTATADDNVGVSRIEIFDNGVLAFAGNESSASFAWNSANEPNGNHVISAKAYDPAGNVGEALIVLTVVNDTMAPTVALTAPLQGAALTGMVHVAADASDDIGVVKAEFFVNGTLHSSSNSAPFGFNWNTATVANGSYTLSAKAYDAAGNAAQSAQVVANVSNDTTAPVVSIVSPAGNSTAGGAGGVGERFG